ncbi:hypothetical protein CDQ84_11810 [Clostridium thermosuccinogenes]|uniref:Uncharacterized protein n=1 Tax=Clostridium thermosuccinogenes TaxID=84032 RepID=A0A2K2FGY6_9CLOT|nr:hypothetical protein [Pseudoclostridium thermosuccinogenes]AUS96246.1 hypothetical protein CDO33_07235 [Pseudoclostridium thermosuccinogenes]PNT96379.1 hypothetical protein CDQ85_11655 [Pseudoclostridium thermosuccinogenes]PNT98032.1 hypothetical protein CDQ84_11810 [Pseudoclostridium thermosuccinogenes]
MRFVIFRVGNGRYAKKREKNRLDIEKILMLLLMFIFAVVIIAQTTLIGPSIRTSSGKAAGIEGKPLGLEEYLYDEGRIGLELLKSAPDENIKILVNGEEVAAFSDNYVSITVRDGDIIEIDGSEATRTAEVAIVSKSDNISDSCANKRLKIDSGVKILTQIKFD